MEPTKLFREALLEEEKIANLQRNQLNYLTNK